MLAWQQSGTQTAACGAELFVLGAISPTGHYVNSQERCWVSVMDHRLKGRGVVAIETEAFARTPTGSPSLLRRLLRRIFGERRELCRGGTVLPPRDFAGERRFHRVRSLKKAVTSWGKSRHLRGTAENRLRACQELRPKVADWEKRARRHVGSGADVILHFSGETNKSGSGANVRQNVSVYEMCSADCVNLSRFAAASKSTQRLSNGSFISNGNREFCTSAYEAVGELMDRVGRQVRSGVIPMRNNRTAVVVEVSLTISSILAVSWTDYQLKWNPREHDNIKKLNYPTDRLWTPDLLPYNSRILDSGIDTSVNCIVMSNGEVTYIPRWLTHTSCAFDATYYPYDVQTCNVKLGSWTHHVGELDLRLGHKIGDIGRIRTRNLLGVSRTRYRLRHDPTKVTSSLLQHSCMAHL
ncbi:hypothetical protein Bbelb_078100 [Branchiostoma belcheri]|nr:hypothetical protein Bbelb_078100 [Branchiostoma belcheri]